MSLIWRPKFNATLKILNGYSYTQQGGWPWAHAKRNDGKQFLLAEALTDVETDVDVAWGNLQQAATATTVRPGTVILIESEQMLVTSVSGATLTVVRGYGGTTNVVHSTGLTITVVTTGDGVIDLTGVEWGSIQFPAAWTAANLAVFGCDSRDGTFVPVRDETGAALMVTGIATGAANIQTLPSKMFAGLNYAQFRSVTVGTDPTSAVNQGADRLLVFHGGE